MSVASYAAVVAATGEVRAAYATAVVFGAAGFLAAATWSGRPKESRTLRTARDQVVTLVGRGSGYGSGMNRSYPFDPDLHGPGTLAARGRCSWHGADGGDESECEGEPVVSFQDRHGHWQAGCQRALEELVKREEIEPLGQGA